MSYEDKREWFECPSDADRKREYIRCPGGFPMPEPRSPTGWMCWWCGDSCSGPFSYIEG